MDDMATWIYVLRTLLLSRPLLNTTRRLRTVGASLNASNSWPWPYVASSVTVEGGAYLDRGHDSLKNRHTSSTRAGLTHSKSLRILCKRDRQLLRAHEVCPG